MELISTVPFATVNGILAGQTEGALRQLGELCKAENVTTIIEIGTGRGATALWLSQFARVVTFDIDPTRRGFDSADNITCINGDAMSIENEGRIKATIIKSGATLVLCDGGDKPREFNLFARMLKKGDFIGVHDFGGSDKSYKENAKARNWPSEAECMRRDLDEKIMSGLGIPAFAPDLWKEFWGVYIKS